jgi:hypothetical protein
VGWAPTGYLAVSPPGFRFRIGVVADDPAEAERRWQAALIAWERLYAEIEYPADETDEG